MTSISNKTKIVATVGPACNTKERLLELVMAGVNVFRLNFSHGNHEGHQKVIKLIREINETHKTSVSILQDLQGPKIRIGEVENGSVPIKEGDELIITNETIVGNSKMVSTSYTALPDDVKMGDSILVDDGKLELHVKKVENRKVYTEVIYGGLLKSRKGMNLPDTDISEPSLTKKDKIDLAFGLENEVDWIAISFVRTSADITGLKQMIKEAGKECRVIAKIERPEAVKNIDGIIAETDALMVARGDLGVETEMADVPMLQKELVKKCNKAAIPVIIATQMMESMIECPRPTRAEANDVANAVYDGTDAVMLSAETASGMYPVQTIQAMTKIIRSVERQALNIYNKYYPLNEFSTEYGSEVVVETAVRMANSTHAKGIIGMTDSGFTAFHLARHRPNTNIFIFTANRKLMTTLNLLWGVTAFYYNKEESTDQTFKDLEQILITEGLLRSGDVFINTASMPISDKLRTNVVKFSIAE